MIVSYNEIPFPEVPRTDLQSAIVRLSRLDVPGLVVRSGGSEDASGLLNDASEALAACATKIYQPMELDDFDFGWHVDFKPTEDDMCITAHQTPVGAVRASLMWSLPALWGLPNSERFISRLPEQVTALLGEKKVDSQFLDPTVYVGELAMGDILLFNQSGPKPTVHKFKSTRSPRSSWVVNALVPRNLE